MKKARIIAVGSAAALILASGMVGSSCGKSDSATDIEELGQQIGDIVASIDESGGDGGDFQASNSFDGAIRTFARVAPNELKDSWIERLAMPSAYASGYCWQSGGTWASCSSGVITRTFSDCYYGSGLFSGTITFTWTGTTSSLCLLNANSSYVTRVPAFTVTGRRGATLTVSKTATYGQKVTRTADGTYTFSNDGINRKFTTASGSTVFDYTSKTTSDIGITGATRATRVVSGGTIQVTNNVSGETCDFTPTSVTWASTCTCPTSGTWSTSCSNGKSGSLTITGCGTGSLTVGDTTTDVTFDRCASAS